VGQSRPSSRRTVHDSRLCIFILISLSILPSSFSHFTSSPQGMDQRQFGGSINHDATLGQQGRPIDSVSEGPEEYEQYEQSAQPPTLPHQRNQLGASWHHQVSFQEPLTYGQSLNSLSLPSTSSVEQSARGELSQVSAFYPSRSRA